MLAFFLLLASAVSVDPMFSFRAAIPQVLFFPIIYFLVIGRVQNYRHVEVLFYSLMGYAFLRLGFIFYFFGRMHGFSVNPLGVGFGGFARLSWQYSSLSIRPMFGVLGDPHNWFADLGTSGGIGALASLLALLITVYMLGFRLCRKLKVDRQYVAVGLLWSLSAYLLSSVAASVSAFNDYETPVVGVGILFWISIGLLVALDRIQRREQQESTFSMVAEQPAGRTLSAKR